MDLSAQPAARRTFAIISHPDAGKTTLTEKFLLYAGRIRSAGMVRGRKGGQGAVSDWMEMERERGISISSSVLRIPMGELLLTVLDTPGHVDFSDDTYRTLTAADCAVLVVDAAKGVEPQTRRLCEVCRLRRIPVIIFVNKMDLEGIPPFDLLAELEQELHLATVPFDWPLGQGRDFRGVVDRGLDGRPQELLLFSRAAAAGAKQAAVEQLPFPGPAAEAALGGEVCAALTDELELLAEAGNAYDHAAFLAGTCSPVLFGSALINFGLEPFFDAFCRLAPGPGPRPVLRSDGADDHLQLDAGFSGYIYKIQANMDPRHRDSLAFLRVCSGRFEREMAVQVLREGVVVERLRLGRAYSLAARERETIDEAWPGDVIAVPNAGLAIGDTLATAAAFWFPRLPQFPPAVFATIELLDPARRKQHDRAIELLAAEGTALVLTPVDGGRTIVGALGRLQLEVVQHRLAHEFGVRVHIAPTPYNCSVWIRGEAATFVAGSGGVLVRDGQGRLLALFESDWWLDQARRAHAQHEFLDHW